MDIEPRFNPTILCDALELKAQQIEGPVDILWSTSPCTHFSQARTTGKTPRDLIGPDKLLRFGIKFAKHFGCPLFMEKPQSKLEHPDVVKDLRMCLVDYCKYGDHRWPKLYRKRTMIFC